MVTSTGSTKTSIRNPRSRDARGLPLVWRGVMFCGNASEVAEPLGRLVVVVGEGGGRRSQCEQGGGGGDDRLRLQAPDRAGTPPPAPSRT
ncbi:hypothetical protein [Streptomyces sp. NPDC049879]|uniref:hypothetical protein n=1 Tax=Streptomyces sp. NPDC049879 TaxID=3365598 RepID=UPI00379613DA